MITDQHRRLKAEFGKISSLYDEARPGYPSSVIDEIIKISQIPETGRVLDIGCGPGRAAVLFGERGYQVTGVDCSEEMIAIARSKSSNLANVSYVIGEFESVELPPEPFDLIVAAQALHWIEPQAGYQRISDLLTASGTLAAFWNFEDYEAVVESRDLIRKVRDLYVEHCPAFPLDLGSTKRYVEALDASGLFKPVTISTHYWAGDLTKEKYVKLARSWAWVSSLPDGDAKTFLGNLSALLEDEPENFTVPFKTVLLTTAKS